MRVWKRYFEISAISPIGKNDAVLCCLKKEAGEFRKAELSLVEVTILLQHLSFEIGIPHWLTS